MIYPLPLPPHLAACSNESAGIGAGIAALIVWGAVAIAVTAVIAIVSGAIVGARKGRVGHQILIHLACGAGLLVLLPIGFGFVVLTFGLYQSWGMARATRDYDAWLAPLRQPVPGEFDRAIGAVMNAKDADTPARRLYLIETLPTELEQLDVALNERERAALLAAAQQLRSENAQRGFGSHPSNLELLDGAVAWFAARPDLAAALQACAHRIACERAVLDSTERWCWRHGESCQATMTPERIAAAGGLFHRDVDEALRIRSLPQRAKEAVARGAQPK